MAGSVASGAMQQRRMAPQPGVVRVVALAAADLSTAADASCCALLSLLSLWDGAVVYCQDVRKPSCICFRIEACWLMVQLLPFCLLA